MSYYAVAAADVYNTHTNKYAHTTVKCAYAEDEVQRVYITAQTDLFIRKAFIFNTDFNQSHRPNMLNRLNV